MKSIVKISALLILWSLTPWRAPQEASAQQVSVSFQLFYDELSPYGMWVDYPNYGYVWIPNEGTGFSPYRSGGRWIFTDDGWTWVSDYSWGWATFHYGRWDYDNVYGWLWVPDDEWGPAWVSWRRSPGYYGWAPLRPGISVSIAFGRDYHEQNDRWMFVREGDFARPDVGRRYVDRSNNATIINNSTVIVNTRRDDRRNVTYIAGPDRDEVQRVTKTSVTPIAIREADRPAQRLTGDELQIYRPLVQKRGSDRQNYAPSRVMKLNDVRPATERGGGNRQPDAIPTNSAVNNQPSESRNPPPGQNKGREQQQQKGTPPNPVLPSQPRNVSPSNPRVKEQEPQKVTSPASARPQRPGDVNPPNTGGKEQPKRVTPPTSAQPRQPRNVSPSNSKGKEQGPQKVTPPRKSGESQPGKPKPNQEQRDTKKDQEK